MIDKDIEKAINKQINEEMYSAYLYLAMSAYFQDINLLGFANWMFVQYQEEISHAMKFYRYLIERGGRVELYAIEQPAKQWDSPLHALEETLKHERHITQCINDLADLAEQKKDRPTLNLLQWYIDEQVEEEANDEEIIAKLKMIGDSPHGLLMIDSQLAQRTFVDGAADEE